MRIVIAPDSFKGSLSAAQAAAAMAAGIRQVWPAADLRLHPMADGGEGTLEAIAAAMPVQWQTSTVQSLTGQPLAARWLRLADGSAVLESAEVVGLGLAGGSAVQDRDSIGLGQLLRAALDAGCRRILLGLGGTGSNDGGAGLLVALGARLFDAQGRVLVPAPSGLAQLARLDLGGLDPRLAQSQLQVLADVASPLAGPHGATAVFGPQKGVPADALASIDASLAKLGQLGDAVRGQNYREQAGSGAAGGLGWALRLLGAQLEPGAELIAALQGLDASLAGADWLLTGEGCSDLQTPLGKGPWRVAGHALAQGVPAVLISGGIAPAARPALQTRFQHCLSLTRNAAEVPAAQRQAADYLTKAVARWAMEAAGQPKGGEAVVGDG